MESFRQKLQNRWPIGSRVRMTDYVDDHKAKSFGTIVGLSGGGVRIKVEFDEREWPQMHGDSLRCWDCDPDSLEMVSLNLDALEEIKKSSFKPASAYMDELPWETVEK